ncbi:MAG: hypothetical protein V3U08_02660, partial [Nitrospirales bacterium]
RVPGIRGYDKPACGYCCMQAGGLATQSLNVLFQYASVLRGSTPGTDCSLVAMGARLRDSRVPVALLLQRVERDEPS